MSIQNILTELWPAITQQQGQKVVASFVATHGGPEGVPQGMTNGQFAELCLKRFIKSVVKGAERQSKESELTAVNAQVDTDFPEA